MNWFLNSLLSDHDVIPFSASIRHLIINNMMIVRYSEMLFKINENFILNENKPIGSMAGTTISTRAGPGIEIEQKLIRCHKGCER